MFFLSSRFSLLTFSIISIFLFSSATAFAEVQSKEISYKADDIQMKGYLAYDDSIKAKRPAILVVHEWWGHNDYARKRANMLAELGYTAFAVDMYGDGKQASHPKDAGAFAMAVSSDLVKARGRFDSAIAVLKNHPTVNKDKIAAIGYCFGGGLLLQFARGGLDIDGIASFHGSLAAKKRAKKGDVKTAVLVCHGADDGFVKKEDLAAFKKEFESSGADYTFKSYAGAKHSFTNPGADENGKKFGIGLAYDEKADKASWADLQTFFKKIFAK